MHPSSRVFGLVLAVSSFFLFSAYFSVTKQEVKGLYVNDFKYILGQKDKEKDLLNYAKAEGFNYLLFYNLPYIHKHMFNLGKTESAQVLAAFITEAKTKYGILEVGAVGETSRSFEGIHQYNKLYGEAEESRIDVYNMEFEFWNKDLIESYYCPTYLDDNVEDCTEKEVFRYYFKNLRAIRDLADAVDANCETYIGLPTHAQCEAIGSVCDRVLVHYYRKSDVYNNGNSIYQYHDYRLSALAPKKGILKIMPIFSARENHMGLWLKSHTMDEAYKTYHEGKNGFEEMNGKWKEHLDIPGAQWYRYTNLVELIIN